MPVTTKSTPSAISATYSRRHIKPLPPTNNANAQMARVPPSTTRSVRSIVPRFFMMPIFKDNNFDGSPAAPAPVQPVVDWRVHQAGVDAVPEALDEAEQKAPPGEPLERRQHHFEKFAHVNAFGRHQTINHAKHKGDGGPDTQRPGDQFRVQHRALQSIAHSGEYSSLAGLVSAQISFAP